MSGVPETGLPGSDRGETCFREVRFAVASPVASGLRMSISLKAYVNDKPGPSCESKKQANVHEDVAPKCQHVQALFGHGNNSRLVFGE